MIKKGLHHHNKNESWEHWLTKAIVYKILTDKGHKVVSEQQIETGKIDIIDLTDRNLIEIETNPKKHTKKDLNKYTDEWNDIFIIPTIKLPIKLIKNIEKIKEKLG